MAHDIAGLEKKIGALNDTIAKLRDAKHAELFIPVIHKPGWTSIVEYELVQFHVDSLTSQVTSIHKSLDSLLAMAKKIGQK